MTLEMQSRGGTGKRKAMPARTVYFMKPLPLSEQSATVLQLFMSAINLFMGVVREHGEGMVSRTSMSRQRSQQSVK